MKLRLTEGIPYGCCRDFSYKIGKNKESVPVSEYPKPMSDEPRKTPEDEGRPAKGRPEGNVVATKAFDVFKVVNGKWVLLAPARVLSVVKEFPGAGPRDPIHYEYTEENFLPLEYFELPYDKDRTDWKSDESEEDDNATTSKDPEPVVAEKKTRGRPSKMKKFERAPTEYNKFVSQVIKDFGPDVPPRERMQRAAEMWNNRNKSRD